MERAFLVRVGGIFGALPTLIGEPSRNGRPSNVAFAAAISVHLIGVAAVLLLNQPARRLSGASGSTVVTLVASTSNSAAAAQTEPPWPTEFAKAEPAHSAPQTPPSTHERLDDLLAESAAPSPQASSKLDSLLGGHTAPLPATEPQTRRSGGSAGAAQPMGPLVPGEALGDVGLYAAASLPPVGPRPREPSGDLWPRILPCWRPAGASRAELEVVIGPNGELAGTPLAIRRTGSVNPAAYAAERSAARATEACAPYTGLGGGKWRVKFPAGAG